MLGIGTIVNGSAIIIGGSLGLLLRTGISERVRSTVMQGVGLAILFIGISGTLQGLLLVGAHGVLERERLMTMILSLVAGGIVGELIDIEGKLENFGHWLERRFTKEESAFTRAFVMTSLIYCVGAMAILGSFDDGLKNDPSVLFAKALLDGITAVIFGATLGFGVIFSFIPVVIYQGTLTLLALQLKDALTPTIITEMSLVGSVLIFGIGVTLLDIKQIKIGNLLPAIFVPPAYYAAAHLLTTLLTSLR